VASEKFVLYVAGPLFTPGERMCLERVCAVAESVGCHTYLPHRDAGLSEGAMEKDSGRFFRTDVRAIQGADGVLAVLNGADVDSGTAWEIGYAYALGIPIVGLIDDVRKLGEAPWINLMIANSTLIVRPPDLKGAVLSLMGGSTETGPPKNKRGAQRAKR
jgi:nucleoside 2-deoxyribosyltransferase